MICHLKFGLKNAYTIAIIKMITIRIIVAFSKHITPGGHLPIIYIMRPIFFLKTYQWNSFDRT